MGVFRIELRFEILFRNPLFGRIIKFCYLGILLFSRWMVYFVKRCNSYSLPHFQYIKWNEIFFLFIYWNFRTNLSVFFFFFLRGCRRKRERVEEEEQSNLGVEIWKWIGKFSNKKKIKPGSKRIGNLDMCASFPRLLFFLANFFFFFIIIFFIFLFLLQSFYFFFFFFYSFGVKFKIKFFSKYV